MTYATPHQADRGRRDVRVRDDINRIRTDAGSAERDDLAGAVRHFSLKPSPG